MPDQANVGIQKSRGCLCRLYQSNVSLSEDVIEKLEAELEPFCYTAGLKYEGSHERNGSWRNFFIGTVGSVDFQEEDVLWPNQACSLMLHGLHLALL